MRYYNIEAFRRDALPLLERNELSNNLQIGLLMKFTELPFMSIVNDELVAFMTEGMPLLIVGHERAIPQLIEDLGEMKLIGINGSRAIVNAFLDAYHEEATLHTHLGKYELTTLQPYRRSHGDFRVVTTEYEERVAQFMTGFAEETGERFNGSVAAKQFVSDGYTYGLFVDDELVTTVRNGRNTRSHAIVNFVYTPPTHRGQGFATTATALLTELLLARDTVKSVGLFTNMANPTSNSIYRKLGYSLFDEMYVYHF